MKGRIIFMLSLCTLVVFGLAISNLYSQTAPKRSFWDLFRSKPPEVQPLETKPSPNNDRTTIHTGIPKGEQIQAITPANILISSSVPPAQKAKIDNWNKDKNFPVFSNFDDMLKNRGNIKSTDRTFLVGNFTLQNITIPNGQYAGLPQKIAEQLGVPQAVIDIKGEVKLRKNATFENVTLNIDAPFIMYDNTELTGAKVIVGEGQFILKGKEGTNVVRDSNITCRTYLPEVLDAGSKGMLITPEQLTTAAGSEPLDTDSHVRLENNEIHHCNKGIFVDRGAWLTAVGNNIYDTVFGVWFAVCGPGFYDSCDGYSHPPRGELKRNQISSSKIGVLVEAGIPLITPGNRFFAGDAGMQIAVVNLSPHTRGSLINALPAWGNDEWPYPVSDANYVLNTTCDTYDGFDPAIGNIPTASLIGDRRGAKNIVNIGCGWVEGISQTLLIEPSCSLIK